jgi:hypothetical protein
MKKQWLSDKNAERAMKIDHTGKQFGIMTCVGRGEKIKTRWFWRIKCQCGNEKQMQAGNMERSKSCGCLTKQLISDSRKQHGMTDSPTWISWKSMHDRIKQSHKSRKDYYDKNITICAEWYDFKQFHKDMGDRPTGKTLDRINNGLGYFPRNCRWADYKKQARNRSSNVFLEINGQTKTIAEYAEENKMLQTTLANRIKRGWEPSEAINRPVKKQKNNRIIQTSI